MTDGGQATGAPASGAAADRPRSYNLPQRYPVPAPEPAPRRRSTDITQSNPVVAQPSPPPAGPSQPHQPPPPQPPPPGQPDRYPPAGRTPQRSGNRTLLITAGIAVVVIAALLGLYLGLSDDSSAGHGATATAAAPTAAAAASAASTIASPTSASPTSTSPPSEAMQICQALSRTAPLDTLIELPHAATSMPASFLVPTAGRRTAVCVAHFAAAGQNHGDVAYVAEYANLPASQYATQLKQAGWQLVSSTPAPTYQDGATDIGTTDKVTLVQQGTTLVMLLDTGP